MTETLERNKRTVTQFCDLMFKQRISGCRHARKLNKIRLSNPRSALACRADHFQHSDLPLLAAYARAVVAELVAAGELAAANVVDDTPA